MAELPTARDYEGFRRLLDARRKVLRMSMLELDHLANMPSGYSAKLLCGNHPKNIGPDSMGKLLAALSVEIAIMPTALGNDVSRGEIGSYPQLILMRERCRKGGLATFAKMSAVKRTALARKGARARWKKR